MEEVNATLSDDDKTWVQIRHMHMKDALDCLVEEFRLFNAEHGSTGGSVCLLLFLSVFTQRRSSRSLGLLLFAALASTTSKICWPICRHKRIARRRCAVFDSIRFLVQRLIRLVLLHSCRFTFPSLNNA